MKHVFYHIFTFAVVALIFSSCSEKRDIEDLLADNGNSEESWTKPTSDGVVQETGPVDLGLSVKWASCNLSQETEDHFAESCTMSGSEFKWATEEIRYPPEEIGGTSFDNATALLGEGWRTPSRSEFQELLDKCRFYFTSYNGTAGYIVTGKDNKAIFMKTGEYYSSSFENESYRDSFFYMYLKYFTSSSSIGISGIHSGNYLKYIRPVYVN